jgi:gliding motility-associated protein GldL
MSSNSIFESKGFKKVMAYIYGWGASVVIIGALFKIMHWPGANAMLIAGLGTEALIFFISVFWYFHTIIMYAHS